MYLSKVLLISIFLTQIIGCSKTIIDVNDKAPHIKPGDRIHNDQATFMVKRIKNDKSLGQTIKQIRENYSSDFDWEELWSDFLKYNLDNELDTFQLKKVSEISYLSCPTMQINNFSQLFKANQQKINLFIEYLKDSKCMRSLNAESLAELITKASPIQLFKLNESFKSNNTKILDINKFFTTTNTNLRTDKIVYLQQQNCSEDSIEFIEHLTESIKDKNDVDTITTSMRLYPQCWKLGNSTLLERLYETDPKAISTIFSSLGECATENCFSSVTIVDFLNEIKFNQLTVENVESIINLNLQTKDKDSLNHVVTEISKHPLLFEALKVISYNFNLINQETLDTLNKATRKYITDGTFKIDGYAHFLSVNSNNLNMKTWTDLFSIHYKVLAQVIKNLDQTNQNLFIKLLRNSVEFSKKNTEQSEQLAVLLKRHLIQDKENFEYILSNLGLNLTMQIMSSAFEINPIKDLNLYEIGEIELLEILSNGLIKNFIKSSGFSKVNSDTKLLHSSWEDVIEFNKVFKPIFTTMVANKKDFKTVLDIKEKVLIQFEKTFHNNIEYFMYLKSQLNEMDASVLIIRHQLRVRLKNPSIAHFDFTNIEGPHQNEINTSNNSYDIFIFKWVKLLATLNIEEYTTLKKDICNLLGRKEINISSLTQRLQSSCYTLNKNVKLNHPLNSSIFSIITADAKNLTFERGIQSVGILDVSNFKPADEVEPFTATLYDHAYSIPLRIKIDLPPQGFTYQNSERSNLRVKENDSLEFIYHHIALPKTPEIAPRPKRGSPSGSVTIKGANMSLPKIFSFGSQGEIKADSVPGGNSLESHYPSFEPDNWGNVILNNWPQHAVREMFIKLRDFLLREGGTPDFIQHIFLDQGQHKSKFCEYVLKISGRGQQFNKNCNEKLKANIESQFWDIILNKELFQSQNNTSLPLISDRDNKVRFFQETVYIPQAPNTDVRLENGPRGFSLPHKINSTEFKTLEEL